jgi:hypothetical protein
MEDSGRVENSIQFQKFKVKSLLKFIIKTLLMYNNFSATFSFSYNITDDTIRVSYKTIGNNIKWPN